MSTSRRTAAVALALLALLAVAGPAVAGPEGWTSHAADAANTGYVPGATGPTTGVSEAWTRDAGDTAVESAAADGYVFAVSDDVARSLNATTGAVRWRAETGAPLVTTPAVTDDRVFVVDEGGVVYGMNRTTGAVTWRKDYPARTVTPPRVENGTLYVAYERDGRTHLLAVNLTTRVARWERTVDGLPDPVAVADGRVYLQTENETGGDLRAYHAGNGTLAWEAGVPGPVGEPTVVGDRVLVTGDVETVPRLYTFDAATGASGWSRGLPGDDAASVATDGERAYVPTRTENGDDTLVAVHVDNGTTAWRASFAGLSLSTPRVDDESVYVAHTGTVVTGMDTRSGVERWSRTLPGSAVEVGAIADPVLVVDGAGGTLTGLAGQGRSPFDGPVPGVDGAGPPTDPDGDGLFEDVDGDGRTEFDDAIALAFVGAADLSVDQRAALDFDGDGDVDFDDAVELAFEV